MSMRSLMVPVASLMLVSVVNSSMIMLEPLLEVLVICFRPEMPDKELSRVSVTFSSTSLGEALV